jgi:hypothetical protein
MHILSFSTVVQNQMKNCFNFWLIICKFLSFFLLCMELEPEPYKTEATVLYATKKVYKDFVRLHRLHIVAFV